MRKLYRETDWYSTVLVTSVPIFKEAAVVAKVVTGKKSVPPSNVSMSLIHREIFELTELTEYITVCQFPSAKSPYIRKTELAPALF